MNNEERAICIDWPVPWDKGAPLPFLLASSRVFLIYNARQVHSSYDRTTVRIVDESNLESKVALVEFLMCYDLKFGGPDENTFDSPLYIRDLQPYNAHIIENSSWLKTTSQISPSESGTDKWKGFKHFILGFHDERFECIAKSYHIEVYSREFDEVCEIAFDRITGTEWWIRGSKSEFRCPKCNKYLGKHVYANFCMTCGISLT
jgi:hypothetical protein